MKDMRSVYNRENKDLPTDYVKVWLDSWLSSGGDLDDFIFFGETDKPCSEK